MSKYPDTFFYEIVDIPANFEINKLKEFCQEIVSKESKYNVLPSIKSYSNSNTIDDACFQDSMEETSLERNKEDSCKGFILHIGSNPDPEVVQKTYDVFENIFENMKIKINTSSKKDSSESNSIKSYPHHNTEAISIPQQCMKHRKKSGKQLTIKRIRKSFLYCQ